VKAGFLSLCSQAAVSLANNKGNIGAALTSLASESTLRALATAVLTASLTQGIANAAGLEDPGAAAFDADQLVYDIQFGAIHAATSATVGTVINGGNYAENLGSAFQSAATGVLGKQATLKLGQAYRDGDLNYVTHKVAHAALGGALAAGTGGDAVSGAIGGVVGEIAAEELTARFLQSQLENPESLRNLTLEKQAELRADTEQLRELGVDFSKLAAGVAAALAGRDVNDAAGAADNAARNNAVMVLPLALEFLDKGLQAYDAYRLAQAVSDGNTEEAEEIAQEIALGYAVDAIPGSVIAVKVGLALKKFGIVGLGAKIVGKYGDDAAGILVKAEDIAQYTLAHGKLPDNFITKEEAIKLGWEPRKGNLHEVAPGKSIGGDIFQDTKKQLPDAPGRTWVEADLDYTSGYRGTDRLLISSDELVYKTTDHYKTFTKVF